MSEEIVVPAPEETALPVADEAPVPLPDPIQIPEGATKEIVRLHTDLVQKDQQFQFARQAFLEFIRTTKVVLGVPTDKPWDISEDATKFFPLSAEEHKARVDQGMAQQR